jgi:MFS family permease
MLVGARVVQGLAAGLLAPTTLSILTRAYQNSEARNRALGIWTAVAIGGGAVGGVIGGLLTSTLAWRWVFFVNVPVGTGLVMAATTRIRPMKRTVKANLDVAGAITVTGSLMAVMWGLARSSSAGWGSTEVITAFAVATTLLAIFAVIELRVARSPLLPFSIFRARSIWAGNLLSFLSFLPVMAIWFFLTLYLQGSRHYTSMQTGLLFVPLSAAVVAGSQVGFRLIRAVNGRMLLAGGGFISAGGLVWLAQLSSSTALVSIISPATLTMAGGGLMFAPITTAATSAPPEQAGLASGLLNTTRQIGGALGLGVLTALATAAGGHQPGPTGGFDLAFKTAALVFAVTALVGLIVLPSARSGRKRQHSSSRRSSRTGKAAPSG